MGRFHRRWQRLGAGLGLAGLLLAGVGCAGTGKGEDSAPAIPTEYYLDANLGFALTHPQTWKESPAIRGPDDNPTITWQPAGDGTPANQPRLSVTSLPPAEAVGGFAALEKRFVAAHPGFEVTGQTKLPLQVQTSRQLTGYTPRRTYLVILVTATKHAFILAASALPGEFESQRPVFQAMLESFTPLD